MAGVSSNTLIYKDVLASSLSFHYSHVCLAPKEQIALHSQKSWELSYVIKGSGKRAIGDMVLPFGSGDLVLIPPQIPHCWYFDHNDTDENGNISNISLTFMDEVMDRIQTAFPELSDNISRLKSISEAISINGPCAEDIIRTLILMKNRPHDRQIALFTDIVTLLGTIGVSQTIGSRTMLSKSEQRFGKIKTYAACNADRAISLDDAAKHLGMSRSSFCVFFKKCTGKTFVQYINEIRIERAKEMLQYSALSVAEIAARVGFNDLPYFHRYFKGLTGLSPLAFRKQG